MPLGFGPIGSFPAGGLFATGFEDIVIYSGEAAMTARAYVDAPGTATNRPAISNDDGYLYHGSLVNSISFTGSILTGVSSLDIYTGFIRFPNVPIPEANLVDSAFLILTATTTVSTTIVLVVDAEDTRFSFAFGGYNNVAGRPTTSTTVGWTIGPVNAGDQVVSPNLATIFQSLVNRSDWLDPNAHAVTLFLHPTSGNVKQFFSVDQDALLCPKLVVTWGGFSVVSSGHADATFTAAPYVFKRQTFTCAATLTVQPNVNFRFGATFRGDATCRMQQNIAGSTVVIHSDATMLVRNIAVVHQVTVSTPTLHYNQIGDPGTTGADPSLGNGVDPATTLGGVGVQILQYQNNTSGSGGVSDNGGVGGIVVHGEFLPILKAADPVTVPQLKFGDPIFELHDLDVSYDNGKTFTFKQLGPVSYGQPIYSLEEGVNVTLNLGFGVETFFRGRIKKINHVGENNGEAIEYEAWGVPNLADEVDVLGPFGDGYYVGQFVLPTTIQIPSGDFVAGQIGEPVLLINAVQGFFTAMTNDLTAHGIPANVDLNNLDKTVVMSLEKRLSGGFYNALKDLVSVDPGVKVWFDDTDQTWKFVRTMEAPVLTIDVQNSYLQAHNWQEDSSDRYTAVILYTSGENLHASIPVTTAGIVPGWDRTLEPLWSVAQNSKEFISTQTTDKNELSPLEKVHREFILTQPIGAVRTGTRAIINVHRNGRWHTVGAEFVAPQVGEPVTQKVRIGILPVGSITSSAQPYARVRADVPVIAGGNPHIPGDAFGYFTNDISVTSYLPISIPDTFVARYPESGYAGDAFVRYGIRREKLINVQFPELTLENAKVLHRLYSDIRMSCSLPIYGDPIRDLLRFMSGRISLVDIHGITGLESSNALITGYKYNFTEDTGTIEISSDLTNFVDNLGKLQ
jgi:hypothetical protein